MARKSVFSYGTAFFGKVALVTLGVGSILAPSDLMCDFSFPSYARFRYVTLKSLPPPHCGGTVWPVTALALTARGLDNMLLSLINVYKIPIHL